MAGESLGVRGLGELMENRRRGQQVLGGGLEVSETRKKKLEPQEEKFYLRLLVSTLAPLAPSKCGGVGVCLLGAVFELGG